MHKILLVEDDEVIRQQVKKMLEQWGYEVVLVEDMGITDLTREGKTDSGNSYSLTYKNNKIQISVTGSEVTENDQTEEASTETAATEEAAPVVTSKTITVGAAAATAEENTEAAAE